MTEIKFEMSIDISDPKAVKACAAFFAALAEGETAPKKRASKKSTGTEIKEADQELSNAIKEAEKVDPTVATEKTEEENTSGITASQIRELVKEKAKEHKTAIRAKLTEFEAANVTKLDPKHYESFMEFLKGLK